ncbi:hypothetical protein [Candidatus Chlorohelix sp.]|uniref:hypothetical protein n=1 Tax=Candidatus Chlorohelix sp. TaxID=3139201 RepID=UPI003070D43D
MHNQLADVLQARLSEICYAAARQILEDKDHFPTYSAIPLETLCEQLKHSLEAVIASIEANSNWVMVNYLDNVATERLRSGISANELMRVYDVCHKTMLKEVIATNPEYKLLNDYARQKLNYLNKILRVRLVAKNSEASEEEEQENSSFSPPEAGW